MQPINKKALELLVITDGEKLKKNNTNTRDILLEFLKNVNPNTTNQSHAMMFNICIEFFKPVHIDFGDIDANVKKRLVLDILSQGDEADQTLQEYLDRLRQTDEDKKNTQESKKRRQQELQQAGQALDVAQNDLSTTQAFLTNLEAGSTFMRPTFPERDEQHNIGNVIFEFSTYPIKQKESDSSTGTDTDAEPAYKFHWSISDPLTGKTTTGFMVTDNLATTIPKKIRVVNKHMHERVSHVQNRKNRLSSSINNLDRHNKLIRFTKQELEASKYNYKTYKKMMEDKYSSRRDDKIEKMRRKLTDLQITSNIAR